MMTPRSGPPSSVPAGSVAAMAAAIAALKPQLKVPFGVNYLWDPVASVALGVATGAGFVREIFTGLYASDMGAWAPRCREALKLRAGLGRPDLKLLFLTGYADSEAIDRAVRGRARILKKPVSASSLAATIDSVID